MPTNQEITLQIEARGEIIASNFDAFAEAVRFRLSTINTDLRSDEDFARAEEDAKAIRAAEESLTAAKAKALADAEQLNALFASIDDLSGDMADVRLMLSILVSRRKEEVRAELLEEAMATLECAESMRHHYTRSMADAMKGKKNIESIRKALATQASIHNKCIRQSRSIISSFISAHGSAMACDADDLACKAPDVVSSELRRRLDAMAADTERKRLRAEAEAAMAEAARLAREAADKSAPPAPQAPAPQSVQSAATEEQPEGRANEDDRAAEWAGFCAVFREAMAMVKAARQKLTHPDNLARVALLAEAVNAAWKRANALGKEGA